MNKLVITLDQILAKVNDMRYYLVQMHSIRVMGVDDNMEVVHTAAEKKRLWEKYSDSLTAIRLDIEKKINLFLEPKFDTEGKLETGNITPETYDEIKRRWKGLPALSKEGFADATGVTISGYRNSVDDFFYFVEVCEYWEGVRYNMRQLANTAKMRDYGMVTAPGKRLRRLIADIKEDVDLGLRCSYDYNMNWNELMCLKGVGRWLEEVRTWRTKLEPAAAALINTGGKDYSAEFIDWLEELHGLVTQIEEAHKHTPLIKGVSPTSRGDIGGGGGGGGGGDAGEGEDEEAEAEAEAEVEESAEASEEKAVERTSAGVGEGSAASLFSQPTSREEEAEQSDKKTKPNVPKSGSKP